MQIENPWNIQSIYELQFFICPSCSYKDQSKQKIIDHAYEIHPYSVNFLSKFDDNSLRDILCPWNELISEIKIEEPDLFNELNTKLVHNESKIHDNNEEIENHEDNNFRKTSILRNVTIDIVPIKAPNCKICSKYFCSNDSFQIHLQEYHEVSNICIPKLKS